MQTIVKRQTWESLLKGELSITASFVEGRKTFKNGASYCCYVLDVKLSDGSNICLARGFRAYGYERDYTDRAEKVLKLIDKNLKPDFWACHDVKNKDMFDFNIYQDDIKSGFYLDITEQLKAVENEIK